jgi:hypothetical protein
MLAELPAVDCLSIERNVFCLKYEMKKGEGRVSREIPGISDAACCQANVSSCAVNVDDERKNCSPGNCFVA